VGARIRQKTYTVVVVVGNQSVNQLIFPIQAVNHWWIIVTVWKTGELQAFLVNKRKEHIKLYRLSWLVRQSNELSKIVERDKINIFLFHQKV